MIFSPLILRRRNSTDLSGEETRIDFKFINSHDCLLNMLEHNSKLIPVKECNASIAAIVVTYNRVHLLSECIASLLKQTCPPNRIYLVDNDSNDGTKEYAEKLAATHSQVDYMRLPINTGGAGGFNAGVKAAYEDGFDWIWLMDDDVEAYPDALEGLLKFSSKSMCIHGQRTNPNGSVYLWEAKLNPKIGFAMPAADKGLAGNNEFCVVNVGCFEGMLIHRKVVEKIGPPDPRFFIAWDDTIYGFLASKWTDVLYVKHLSLKRKRSQKNLNLGIRTFVEVSDLYRFYHIRNRALVKEYLRKEPEYSNLLFNLMTGVLFIKEILRALVLQRNPYAIKSLWRGLLATNSITHRA